MTAAVDIIHNALQDIGAHSLINPADASLVAEGVNRLNSILAGLADEGIDLKAAPADVPADDIGEPRGAYTDLVAMLAKEMCGPARVAMTPDKMTRAAGAFERLRIKYDVITIPNAELSSHLPYGQGTSRGVKPRTFFKGRVENDDGTTTT